MAVDDNIQIVCAAIAVLVLLALTLFAYETERMEAREREAYRVQLAKQRERDRLFLRLGHPESQPLADDEKVFQRLRSDFDALMKNAPAAPTDASQIVPGVLYRCGGARTTEDNPWRERSLDRSQRTPEHGGTKTGD